MEFEGPTTATDSVCIVGQDRVLKFVTLVSSFKEVSRKMLVFSIQRIDREKQPVLR